MAMGQSRVQRQQLVRGLGLMLLALAVLAPRPVEAYCRTRTCEFRREGEAGACTVNTTTGCSTSGPYVFWAEACIPFAIQRDGSVRDQISAQTLEALVGDGFRVWSELSCREGGTPELAASSQGRIACDEVEYNCNAPEANSNLIMFRDSFQDPPLGLRLGVIALTTLTANLVTGELYDADIEINTRDEDFTTDGTAGVEAGEPRDLRGVVNHELGHLLGLSHTRVTGALMRLAYEGTTEPHEDDIDGMCAALGASDDDPMCLAVELGVDAGCVGSDVSCTRSRPTAEPRGCTCSAAGSAGPRAGWVSGLGLAAWMLGRLRRRRRSVL